MQHPSLIPIPRSLEWQPGFFPLRATTRIGVDPEFRAEAEIFAERVRRATGCPLKLAAEGEIRVARVAEIEEPEGYRLAVSKEALLVEAAGAAGAFYGLMSLLQLFPPAIWGNGPRVGIEWVARCCRIEDGPRFQWRGLMLDSARSFQPPEAIKRWIDLLAQHKLNVFHWHLTDSQGWRVAIDRYPKLTEVGAWRNGTTLGHCLADAGNDNKRYGGFYSKAEIRDIVKYAAARHITVVPEIDMPGHAQAAIAAYP